jgi:hypothetical protein
MVFKACRTIIDGEYLILGDDIRETEYISPRKILIMVG